MTTKQANWLLIGWCGLFLLVIAVATFLTMTNQPKRSAFVEPVIWRAPFTDGEKQLEPEI